MNGSESPNATICAASEFLREYRQYSLISQVGLIAAVSVFITAAACFMQRRNRYQKCCNGFPGLPSPMDFLVTPRHRWVYVALFFVMAASLINAYASLSFSIENIYLSILYRIIILPVVVITIMTIQFFPLFVCVDGAPFPACTITHALGLFYSIVWLGGVISYEANTYLQYVLCNEDGDITVPSVTLLSAEISADTPLFLTGGCIVLWYLYHFLADLIKLMLTQRNIDTDDIKWVIRLKSLLGMKTKISKEGLVLSGMKSYHVEHVRCLLVKPPPQKDHKKVVKLIIKLYKYFFPYNRYDRLPVPYLGSVAAVTMLLYQLSLLLLARGSVRADAAALYTQQIQLALNLSGPASEALNRLVDGLRVLLIVPPFVSSLLVFVLIVHMTGAVSKDLKKAAKYGISEKLPSTLSIVPGMWKYIGIQIGYALSAWIIYTVVTAVILLALGLIFFVLVHFTDMAISIALAVIIPFLFPKAIYYAQYLICRFIFFEDRQGKFISITNRRLFNWFAFILFFYNGIAGLVGAILRAFMSSFFGLLLLFRLDRIVLMKGFEAFDFGHKKYLGFLFLYSTYNNAVVHIFIRLLINSVTNSNNLKAATPETTFSEDRRANLDDYVKDTAHDIELIEAEPPDRHSPVPSNSRRRAKNRWLVAYTMVQNPSLVALTATNLQQTQPEKATCKNVDHDSSSLNNGSNQHSTSSQSPLDSELSPNCISHVSVHSSDIEDTVNASNACNDSEGTTQYPLVVIADSSGGGIEPGTGVDADLTKDSCEHKIEPNFETGLTSLTMEQSTNV